MSYVLHEDINNSLKILILEEWKSQEAIDFHNQTEHFLILKTELGKKADSLTIDIIRASY
ncbi:antibiotic biosynthesis monooxygenase family protein [Lacinutrix sp. MEBiC02404]